METIQLIIDNKEVEVPRGTTILDAAKSVGIHIPTLCYMKLEDLHYENNPGACRPVRWNVRKAWSYGHIPPG